MAVLKPVIDQQKNTRRRQALYKAIEKGLRFAVDPMQVLNHQQDRLLLALAEKQLFECCQGPLTTLGRIERLPGGIVHRYREQ